MPDQRSTLLRGSLAGTGSSGLRADGAIGLALKRSRPGTFLFHLKPQATSSNTVGSLLSLVK